ncbi:Peptide hydrolase [Mycena chlorophos]|uniref:Peptide hydrolase n=1 Tax=Mycena chlorophos TaxID=658473 RepID=A0A8H6TNE2_MYCCL|nr:Peptide hydrolase [Mycena chlorophos]
MAARILYVLVAVAVLAQSSAQFVAVQDHPEYQAIFQANGYRPDRFHNHHNVPGFDLDLDAVRVVQFSLEGEPVLMTEREKLHAKSLGMKYLDVTDVPPVGKSLFEKKHFSYPPPNSTLVHDLFPSLQLRELKHNLNRFTSFQTRYYNSETGQASSEWLANRIRRYVRKLASPELQALVSVTPFKHKWLQTSVIVRIAPPNATLDDPTTVIGAHCDSINHSNPYLRAPGADDDGSGTVTILETLRVLLENDYIPNSPLEFHFYSAEEANFQGGLLGSLDVVAAYEKAQRQIKGMLHFDMTAWVATGSEEVVNILTNDVDPDLTEFLTQLAERYVEVPWRHEKLMPGAGSDHMSWTRSGYQSCVGTEGLMADSNFGNIHTVNDRISVSRQFSFEHMLHFSRLALGFAVELTK